MKTYNQYDDKGRVYATVTIKGKDIPAPDHPRQFEGDNHLGKIHDKGKIYEPVIVSGVMEIEAGKYKKGTLIKGI